MCEFFSIVTEPEGRGGERFYFKWTQRNKDSSGEFDSHSTICKHYKLDEDVCNKYEFNPLTKEFEVDRINSEVDDRVQVEEWVNNLDFKKVVKPLIVKPIIHPFNDVSEVEQVTEEHIKWLKEYISVWDSVGASVRASVRASVYAYTGTFFNIPKWKYIKHKRGVYPFKSIDKLWNMGLVPSFDGKIWRLHGGRKAKILFEISKKELEKK